MHAHATDGIISLLERRLQILIDQERFRLLEAEAGRMGRSVASIVRGALDVHFEAAAGIEMRAAAAERLLADPAVPEEPVEWPEAKRELQASLDRVGDA